MASGIYCIRNLVDSNLYVGSAVNLDRRWSDHRRGLRKGVHGNRHLQRAWNRYGEEVFLFELLEEVVGKERLLEREQHYLDTLLPAYNLSPTAGSWLGGKHTKETKLYLKAVLSTPDATAASSERAKARWADQEYRDRVSAAMKAAVNTPDALAALSERSKALWEDHPQYRAAHSELIKTMWKDSRYRERVTTASKASATAQWAVSGAREMMIAAMKAAASTPEATAAQSERSKATWERIRLAMTAEEKAADSKARSERAKATWERKRLVKEAAVAVGEGV